MRRSSSPYRGRQSRLHHVRVIDGHYQGSHNKTLTNFFVDQAMNVHIESTGKLWWTLRRWFKLLDGPGLQLEL